MGSEKTGILEDGQVFVARIEGDARYPDSFLMPCEVSWNEPNSVKRALEQLFQEAGWDGGHTGRTDWNPLGELIRPGDTVLLKPNWVHHCNASSQGMDCLVTHVSVLQGVLDYVLRAKPGQVVVGDAPLQGCDLDLLMAVAGYSELRDRCSRAGAPVRWADFRRTILDRSRAVWKVKTDQRPLKDYVLFDLGRRSLLEPISQESDRFRVTMYNPELMHRTHAPGKHQYLVAREAIEADVVVNLPKLKTHKKAGLTGALKNIVGVNGNKEYLPHHRLGGGHTKGDCYAGGSLFKLLAEHLWDAANRRAGLSAMFLRHVVSGCCGLARLSGADSNMEGSWYGNDTIWRTCLDLNRLLLYGRLDGTVGDLPHRRVLSITDAILCGEGEGPLAPTPHPLGMLTLATNPVAAEYVHAHLMGFDWHKIPIIREAFGRFDLPIANFTPSEVTLRFEGQPLRQPWPSLRDRAFLPPKGWKGHCEQQADAGMRSSQETT